MSLTEQIVGRIGNDLYLDVLPDKLQEQAEEDENLDPEEFDLTLPTDDLYSSWTRLRAFATTLAIGIVLWPALLVAMGHLSIARLLTADILYSDLFTFIVYGYFAVALAIGTGASTVIWYIWRAPPEVRDHINNSPPIVLITTTVVAGLAFLLAALGGWLLVLGALLGGLVALLVLLLLLVLSIPLGIYGLIKRDPTAIIISIGVIVVGVVLQVIEPAWVLDVPTDYYVLAASYTLALLFAVFLPEGQIEDELEAYRKRFGELQIAHDLLQVDIEHLRAVAPEDYPVNIGAPNPDAFESAAGAETAVSEAFDLVDVYERHLDVRSDLPNQREGSNVAELLLTAAAATHPRRYVSPAVAMEATDALGDLVAACKRFDTEELTMTG